MVELTQSVHKVTVADPSNGFAPAAVCTTTNGIEYLLQALRTMSPEAPEMELHEVMVQELQAALHPAEAAGEMSLRQVELTLRAMQSDVRKLVDGVLPWGAKYSLIFSDHVYKRVHDLFRAAGLRFEYCEADGSYEDDVRAFADGLDKCLSEVPSFVDPVS